MAMYAYEVAVNYVRVKQIIFFNRRSCGVNNEPKAELSTATINAPNRGVKEHFMLKPTKVTAVTGNGGNMLIIKCSINYLNPFQQVYYGSLFVVYLLLMTYVVQVGCVTKKRPFLTGSLFPALCKSSSTCLADFLQTFNEKRLDRLVIFVLCSVMHSIGPLQKTLFLSPG